MDILWLQRDFGIYVVNMFDTGQAMRQLQYAKYSLQYLVYKHTACTLDKQYQRKDWRLRYSFSFLRHIWCTVCQDLYIPPMFAIGKMVWMYFFFYLPYLFQPNPSRNAALCPRWHPLFAVLLWQAEDRIGRILVRQHRQHNQSPQQKQIYMQPGQQFCAEFFCEHS